MQTSKTKTLSELKVGDTLKRVKPDEMITIKSILKENETEIAGNHLSFYFENCGIVVDTCLRKFVKSNDNGILVYN
jgi:hypothetical protein